MGQVELVFLGLGEGNWVNVMAGEDIVRGQVVYQTGEGTWKLTDPSNPTKMPARGLVMEGLIEEDYKGKILLHGIMGMDTWNWIPGGIIYVDTVVGGITQTKPNAEDYEVMAVGIALHDPRYIYFNPASINELSGGLPSQPPAGGQYKKILNLYIEVVGVNPQLKVVYDG